MLHFKDAPARVWQVGMMNGQKLMRFGIPELVEGNGCISRLPEIIDEDGIRRVMIVAGKTVSRNGMLDKLTEGLDSRHISWVLFDGADPDPSIENVEDCCSTYLKAKCEAFVAVGGGSSMDCAKIAAARAANPNKSVAQLGGVMKVRKRPDPIYAVPTTAGTGSETTVAAVVTDKSAHHKYSVTDPKILPKAAVLDPELTLSLPPAATAWTGMDALTHAVEAYTNKYGSSFAYNQAKRAVKLIFENIKIAYDDGSDVEARANMLKASFYAGTAFTRNCVGYVHAIGHPLGGMYGIPHGEAMAAVMPVVLKSYGDAAVRRLAELGTLVGIKGNSEKAVAQKFIAQIEEMNRYFGIPEKFDCIKKFDIKTMADFAVTEANPLYPVPKIWDKKDIEVIYYALASEL
jgi:Alcohol dehydrogenase, class IV